MNIIKQIVFLIVVLFVLGWNVSNLSQTNDQIRQRGELTVQELKLRQELEKDSSFTLIPCRSPDNEVRLLLYNAAKSGSNNKTVKAKMICGTKEGTKVPSYLIVSQGKITYVVDTSRDKFGAMRFYSKTCESLTLGKHIWLKGEYGTSRVFEPIQDSEIEKTKDKVSFVLQCENKVKDELSDNQF